MVFVGGPRQVGKTTLAKSILGKVTGYLNWDVFEHREKILKQELPKSNVWVFDEIHKYHKWRNYLKGLFDSREKQQQFLITGSARLDYYRFGGDSLQGRYHYLRLHPLSVAELKIEKQDDFNSLIKLGGFPEPYFSASEREARRWSKEYRNRIVREEILGLEHIQDISSVELLMNQLPNLVGSPLSINNLSNELQVSFKTVSRWITVLERLYAVFGLLPFGSPKIKAIKKSRKHYHYDWTLVAQASLRFENVVACHLLKWVNYRQDVEGWDTELRYFRDIEGREVDFVVVEEGSPVLFLECKAGDRDINPALKYLKAKFPEVRAVQIAQTGAKSYISKDGVEVCPALKFLQELV